MNTFVHWCYRIGLICGAIAVVSAFVIALFEFGTELPLTLQSVAERAFLIFGLGFMWLGLVLLISAIAWLMKSWSTLSKPVKVVSVLGLGASTILGAYVFHWLLPHLQAKRTSSVQA